jgi:hypothetical protein
VNSSTIFLNYLVIINPITRQVKRNLGLISLPFFLLSFIVNANTQFENVTVAAGLQDYIADSGDIHGPGAVFTDLNSDGLPDLYLLRGSTVFNASSPNELYINDGNGSFYRLPNDAGAGDDGAATGAIAADYDNDGDVDLYVLNFNGANVLLQNQLSDTGTFSFIDHTPSTAPTNSDANQIGLAGAFDDNAEFGSILLDNSLTAAWSDVDRDGDLDLFVGNHDSFCLEGNAEGPSGLPGQRDIFYRNNGDGTFSDVTVHFDVTGYQSKSGQTMTSGQHFSSSIAIVFADFDNDLWPDLLVTNKVGGSDDRNMLYRNLGDDAIGKWLGFELVTYDLTQAFGHNSGSAMGVDVGDPDNDGDLDIYISGAGGTTPGSIGKNDFWVNQFSETGELSFIYSSELPALFSWGVQWQDFDLDGRQDLHVASHGGLQDRYYSNQPSGWKEQASIAGIDQQKNSRANVSADYNRDGWPDIFVVNKSEMSALYKNRSEIDHPDRRYLVLSLEGNPELSGPYRSNRSAIGARVRVMADVNGNGSIESHEFQIREVVAGSSNAGSTSSHELEFGLGLAQQAQIEVKWPSGRTTVMVKQTNQHLQIIESIGSGELLKNGDFASEKNHWKTSVGGSASATWQLEDVTPNNKAISVDIKALDSQPWNVMLQQSNIAIEENRTYRLHFRARASVPNSGLMATVGQNYTPFSPIGLNKYFALTTQWQNYSVTFQATSSDINARIAFLLGFGEQRKVWIDELELILVPQLLPNTELIKNGDFESLEFSFTTLAMGNASGLTVNKEALSPTGSKAVSVEMVNGGSESWEVQLGQKSIPIVAGQKYLLTFGAKAATSGSIATLLMQDSPPWSNLGHYAQFDVSTEWQSYSVLFEATVSVSSARLAFLLGGNDGKKVWLDRISLKPWVPPPVQAISPAELLPNGGFEQGSSGWRFESFNSDSVDWAIDPTTASQGLRSLRASINNASGVAWHIQLINEGHYIEKGREYRISFDAKSDVPGFALLSVDQNHAPWQNLGLKQAIPLTTEWQTFVIEFTATATDSDARISIQLGDGPLSRNVWVDNAGATANCGVAFVPPANLTIIQGSGTGNFVTGDQIPVSAIAPEEGYYFSHWTSSGGGTFANPEDINTIFTMPDNPVTLTANFLPGVAPATDVSAARRWNEVLLQAIRSDFARPTIHARNLFHTSSAMYDAWSAFALTEKPWLLGRTRSGVSCDLLPFNVPNNTETARAEAISFASYRLLRHRFASSPGAEQIILDSNALMSMLGHDVDNVSTDYVTGSAAALGNHIAQCYIEFGLADGANEQNDYINTVYQPVNQALEPQLPGNPNIVDLNRWQPLKLEESIDQSGNQISTMPEFLGPEWGQVIPFALSDNDLSIYTRDGFDYWLFHDPGAPPSVESDMYKWAFSLVSIWSAHLDPSDGVMIDISPASIGNIQQLPTNFDDYPEFYDTYNGGDPSIGYTVNPATGQPYTPQLVPRGDYARVLAEYWADGPSSETPPGHWYVLLNEVSDHPMLEREWNGAGAELNKLEWDVKSYFVLGGAMHDSAIAAWGAKGWYDYIRPISSLRAMADLGQSTDSNLPSWHPNGITLHPGYVELIDFNDPLAGQTGENIGKIKVNAWKGPDAILDPEVDEAGVEWILAENWWPYQRPSFVTPPFAGYVSGHSTFSRAAAEVLTNITGNEYFPGGIHSFVIPQNDFLVFENGPSINMSLQWATYKDASDQCSLSRIWGGIHPPLDDIPGRIMGAKIGVDAYIYANSYFNGSMD